MSRFSIIFPLKPEHARFFTRGHLQDTQELTGFGWEGRGATLWLGNQDKGLYFSCDTPLFLSDNPRTQMQIIEEKGRTCLRLNFVNAPGQIKDADHIFRFFLQPTPTKKPSLAKSGLLGGKVALWFEEWSDYQGYPDLKKMPEVAKRSAEAHKNGQQQIVYFNQMLAENSPGFQEFKADFLVPPGSDVVSSGPTTVPAREFHATSAVRMGPTATCCWMASASSETKAALMGCIWTEPPCPGVATTHLTPAVMATRP